ncbi:TlpA family protein disulfide reductase [Streptomyces sudanensis]|uniref:TlpA family protein disulfide reductase n=1 Tax=Streptomyces sudanensis TaxID=436397 RepID=UPI0020CF0675|nr:TlpA disulfide reductase family protein [Streptomyces sudanensis]MCP9987609.1 TlpA family protein disulfide reductase [Streptomyces sudanensis]
MAVDGTSIRISRGRVRRPRVPTLASVALLSLLSACAWGGSDRGGHPDSGFVTSGDGIDRVEEAHRMKAPQLTGETLQGRKIDLGAYKGKVIVLNVWGSWCTPCRAEAPHLAKVAKDLKADGVEFVGINTRNRDKTEPLKFEKDYGVSYPSFYDPYGKLLLEFPKGSLNPQLIPSTIVIDRQGGIAARAMRALNEDQLRNVLRPLVEER